MNEFKYSKIRDVKSPNRANKFDAGIDFFVPNDFKDVILHHGDSILIPSGIKVNIPHNHALIAHNKSGIASKKSLDIMACVIDETYQGEIHINLINNGETPQIIKPGDKIIQFILTPVNYENMIEVSLNNLYDSESSRGEGGFGSTSNI